MNLKNFIKATCAIKAQYPNSRFDPGSEEPWNETHDWVIVEESAEHVAWLDKGFGLVALTRDSELVGIGARCVTSEAAVLLDRDYFGVPKYIWK